jgi:hypothetical protein
MSACDNIDPKSQARIIENLEKKLAESMGSAQKDALRLTTAMMFEILLTIHISQRRRNETADRLRENVRHVEGEKHFTLLIYDVETFDQEDNDALRRICGSHLIDLQFQFTSLATGDRLPKGLLIASLLLRTSEGELSTEHALLRAPYIPPAERRRQTVPIGFTNSVVSKNDQKLVLELVDDIYNMHQLMSLNMKVALEPIVRDNYAAVVASQKRKRDPSSDVVIIEESSAELSDTRPLGYTVHFAGVPSFSDTFLEHLKHKYASRWLYFVVLFPHERMGRAGPALMPAELLVSISSEGMLPCDSLPYAMRGSKRLCQKVYSNPSSQ